MRSSQSQKRVCYKALLFLFLIILLAACSGSEDSGGAGSAIDDATAPDACALLPTADVETVLGSPVSSIGTVDENGLFSNCTWLNETSGARLTLNIWAAGEAEDGWATQFLSSQAGAGNNVPIENLGDEAYRSSDGDFSNYLWQKNDTFVVVLTTTVSEASQDDMLNLARRINDGL